MNIHEYQAKELLKSYGLPVSDGVMITSLDQAMDAINKLNANITVVKAQIHAGGRGKAGGVLVCKDKDSAQKACDQILGKTLITHQTSEKGQLVRKIYLENGVDIDKEFYLSFVLDRTSGCITLIASAEGGTEIEEVFKTNPEKIIKILIHPATGIMKYHVRQTAAVFSLTSAQSKPLEKILKSLYQVFSEKDAALLEINPFVITKEGNLHILDAKLSFDDNALFKHPDIEALRDTFEEDPSETKAREFDLNYIKLNGSIGCMVNGAGLAMATMDIIKLHGQEPANFLDVGGGATQEKVAEAFSLILSDSDVKGVLVNIFGGIMKCDIIAQGIVDAAKTVNIKVPLVVRLQGTNADLGRKILESSGLDITPALYLEEAAKAIVQKVQGA